MEGVITLILMFLFMFMGLPIGLCLVLPLLCVIFFINQVVAPEFLFQAFYSGVASWSLLACPFFILSGAIMETGGLSKRLVRFAHSLIGNVYGSEGFVAIMACVFFGAVCGNAGPTVAAIATIMLPQMVRAGYNKYFATALVIAAGGIGILIPPSYSGVIYGVTFDQSISEMFTAGIIPGIMVAGCLGVVNYIYARKNGLRADNQKVDVKEIIAAFKDGFPALMMPIIILGGIYSGIFTTTESAVVACVYGILVGLFWYKELTFQTLMKIYRKQSIFVGSLMLTLAPASAIGKIFSRLGINQAIVSFFLGISTNKYVIMFMIYVVLLIAGMFLTTTPVIVIMGPMLLPVAESVGCHPVQFGIVMILGITVGVITPPVANSLYLGASMTGLPIQKILKPMWPMLISLFLCEVLVGYFSIFTMGLVNLFGG